MSRTKKYNIINGFKICNTCKINKSITEYPKKKDSISASCKICKNKRYYEKVRPLIYKGKIKKFKIKDGKKICSKCNIEKRIEEYPNHKGCIGGIHTRCKECEKIYIKNYRLKNKKTLYDKRKEYRRKNLKEIKEKERLKYLKRKPEIQAKAKINKIHLREDIKAYKRNRHKNNILIRLSGNMSNQIRKSLKLNKNNNTWSKFVDFNIYDLKAHLESKFTKGMTWENYGKFGWHIDHCIPVTCFKYNNKNHPAFKACWALSNLQPLWSTTEIAILHGESKDYIGNIDKGNRIIITPKIQKFLNKVNGEING